MITTETKLWSLLDHIGGKCPSCGSTDIQKQQVAGEDGARWKCCNPDCPAQLAARIEHFCSRKCLDIEGIGEECSAAIADAWQDFCHDNDGSETITAADMLLKLIDAPAKWLAELRWITESGGSMTFGDSRAQKAVAAFKRAKSLPLHRWLFALGIPSIGENTSIEVGRLFKYPGDIQIACLPGGIVSKRTTGKVDASLEDYQISGRLGPDSARKLIDFVNSPAGGAAMTFLARNNIAADNYNPIPKKVETNSIFNGKIVVITGTLSVGRSEMKALLEKAGAKVGDSISAKTDFLVFGDKAGSKLEKAKRLGVEILTEDEARAGL